MHYAPVLATNVYRDVLISSCTVNESAAAFNRINLIDRMPGIQASQQDVVMQEV